MAADGDGDVSCPFSFSAVRVGDPDLRRARLRGAHGGGSGAAAVRRVRGGLAQRGGRQAGQAAVRPRRRGQRRDGDASPSAAGGDPVRGEQQLGRGHVAGPEGVRTVFTQIKNMKI